jgi:amidase
MYQIPFPELEEQGISELQAALETGALTSRRLVEMYAERIEAVNLQGPALRAVLEINPDALALADELDKERRERGPRGPLHGIPLLLKDNIATADRQQTTAGSLALLGAQAPRDAFVAARLRAAGAILLGKTNLSEWANFRSTSSSSGWSARGGQALNPYVLDRSPCGSSSGSATAVAANLAAASLGTETDGSILCPAAINGIVGIKPTVGLTSRAGVIPIAHSQDTVGPFARTVTDAALLLGAITGVDERDEATRESAGQFYTDYTPFLDPRGLEGARIGVPRQVYTGYHPKVDALFATALTQLREAGAIIVDPADIPTAKQMGEGKSEQMVLLYELKADLNAYLAELTTSPVRSLAELIAFNQEHASEELLYFAQEHFLAAEATSDLKDPIYLEALAENHRLARQEGIDKVMNDYGLDALVSPTISLPCRIDLINGDFFAGASTQPTALAGYPAISVPAGFIFDLPVGLTFLGRAYSEPTLIKLAYAFEQQTRARRVPQYLGTTPR